MGITVHDKCERADPFVTTDVICHSHEMLKGFTGLLNVDEWLTDFLPGGWEYPTYAAEEGVASPSIIVCMPSAWSRRPHQMCAE